VVERSQAAALDAGQNLLQPTPFGPALGNESREVHESYEYHLFKPAGESASLRGNTTPQARRLACGLGENYLSHLHFTFYIRTPVFSSRYRFTASIVSRSGTVSSTMIPSRFR